MRSGALVIAASLVTCILTACGGHMTDIGSSPSTANVDAGAGDGESDAHTSPPGDHVPAVHRPAPTTCTPYAAPPEPVIPDAGLGPSATFECRKHADCTAHPRGYCEFFPTDIPVDPGGTRCVYECLTDADCSAGSLCGCTGGANVCIPSTCRTDADCGAHGYCSPETDACGSSIDGWRCHTGADTCTDDADCKTPTSTSNQACRWNGASWSCQIVGCASAR